MPDRVAVFIDWQNADHGLAIEAMLMGVAVRWIGRQDDEAVGDPTDDNIRAADARTVRH